MEFDDLFQPVSLATDYATGVLTRLFGPIVPQLHGGWTEGTVSVVGSNWLENIFVVFNNAMLLGMLIVASYTVYAMVFDTAADGKTFGERADTKYTILRSLLGLCALVPVSGGYSLVQIGLIWGALQGSALADTGSRLMASDVLAGTPLVSGTISTIPPSQQARIRQFGEVFDTLVTGHLCGINANAIAKTLQGQGSLGPPDVTTIGADAGPMREMRTPVTIEASTEWGFFTTTARGVMNARVFFGEDSGGASYSGRNLYCGSINIEDSFSGSLGPDGTLEGNLAQARAETQFRYFVETVLPTLSSQAHAVAMSLYQGERDQNDLITPSRTAIYAAVADYASVSGASLGAGADDAVSTVHDQLLTDISNQGWMIVPVWQRGVAQTVGALEMPGDTLQVSAVRENRITDFLSGRGYRANRDVSNDLLISASASQDAWDEIAGGIRGLSPSDVNLDQPTALGGSPDTSMFTMQGFYTTILSLFSPVANANASGMVADPMLQLQRQGAILAGGGTAALVAGGTILTVNSSFFGSFSDFVFGTGEVVGGIGGSLVTVGMAIILAGMVMMIVLPLIPMIYFFTAVLSWLFQIVELMFAVPLAVMQLFSPSREGVLFGQQVSQIILAFISVVFRPFFMIAGLFISMTILSIGLDYLHEIFSKLVFFIAPDNDPSVLDVTAVGAVINMAEGVGGLVKLLFYLGLYVLMAFLTVLYGSQLITEFGDYAFRLLGHTVNHYSQAGNIADRTVMAGGLSYAGMSRGTSVLGNAAGKRSSEIRGVEHQRRLGQQGASGGD